MVDIQEIKKRLEKNGIKLTDREIKEREEKFRAMIRGVVCLLCKGKFTEEEIQTKKYAIGTSCPPSTTRYYHPDCLKWEREKKNNPLLFAKVERLERELEQIKKRVER